MSKAEITTPCDGPPFKAGQQVRWKNNPEAAVFTVAFAHDMTLFGWQEKWAINPRTVKGQLLFIEPCDHFISDYEYRLARQTARLIDSYSTVTVSIAGTRMRIRHGEGSM